MYAKLDFQRPEIPKNIEEIVKSTISKEITNSHWFQ